MNLKFKKIKIINFGCYQEVEIDLQKRGICLVSGENHCSKDGAASNGSGKSTLWNAICYALTGSTISGQTKNLKNMYTDENECYVRLEMSDGKDEYVITRYNKPKSDLKIIKNDTDISGKGITESSKILEENLPELTYNLVANTIILGQGLPAKFSSFTPSGRKDLLEKFTNSSAMIEQAKCAVKQRLDAVVQEVNEYEKSILVTQTNLSNQEIALKNNSSELENLKSQDYDSEISNLTQEIDALSKEFSDKETVLLNSESDLESSNAELLKLTEEKSKEVSQLNENYSSVSLTIKGDIQKLELEIKSLNAEISRISSIRDTCPTCGQKLQNVVKPNTDEQQQAVIEKKSQLNVLKEELKIKDEKFQNYKQEIDKTFAGSTQKLQTHISQLKNTISGLKQTQSQCNAQLSAKRGKLDATRLARDGRDNRVSYLERQIIDISQSINQYKNNITLMESAKSNSEAHLSVIKQIESRINRDFRGKLLENVINYIDAKAKEYSKIVFGTADLALQLDGNNLDISYCGKPFDCLSGGEKQRVDLILQFSIRDLLQNSLNYRSNILVLDEITDALDVKSCEAVLKLIENKLTDVESIFVISHRATELNLPIDTEIRVVKNESGISEIF